MDRNNILQRIERIEANAKRLLNDATALREELSGGSDSSISKPALSKSHKEQIISKRRKTQNRKK